MCSHANTPSGEITEPGMMEKASPAEFDEKTQLSVIPSPDLLVLSPDYATEHIKRVLQEGILLASGGVAILLQMANPGVAKGVNLNSNFAYRPSDRLRTTMIYMYCMTFGTPQEKRIIIQKVHEAHQSVRGPDYTADDPDLQLWVAATLYACGVDVHEKVFGPLDNTTADKVYQEYSVMATALRVPIEMWPETRKAFWQYWDEKIETFEITEHAKKVAQDLLYNKVGPLWLRASLPLIRLTTAEWLPPRMREAYGLKTTGMRRRLYKFTMAYTRAVYPRLPTSIRQYPLKYYLKDMRKGMKKMGEV